MESGSGLGEDDKDQVERLKVEVGADNQSVRYCESSNLEEPINSVRVVTPGSRRDGPRKSGRPRREDRKFGFRPGRSV